MHCCIVDMIVFNPFLQCDYSFAPHLVYRPTIVVEGSFSNLYAVAPGIILHTTPEDQDCFINNSDIDYPSDWYPEYFESNSDQKYLL